MVPETRYTRTDGVNIAYQVVGDGSIDLVVVPGWLSNIEVFWEEPRVERFLRGLASFSRLILFDKRGTGLSDRVTDSATLEERMDDVRAVMDAVGSQRAALFGYSEGGAMCALFAATYPERVRALIMAGSFARRTRAADYPWAPEERDLIAAIDTFAAQWGGPVGMESRMPSVSTDVAARQWWSKYLRLSASPSAAVALSMANLEVDIRHLLPSIRVPTLILHAKDDLTIPINAGRYLAANIQGAQFVTIDTIDHVPFFEAAPQIARNIEIFVTGHSSSVSGEGSVQTICFADIVGSTEMAARIGDQRWTDLLNSYYAIVRSELAVFRGREVNTVGDGFVASFDGPARAVRCAGALTRATQQIGLEVRIGLHTGECEMRAGSLSGIALHIAARVSAMAPSGGILVSQTVKDLVAGSGLKFTDAGSHVLKGVPEEWRLYNVVAA